MRVACDRAALIMKLDTCKAPRLHTRELLQLSNPAAQRNIYDVTHFIYIFFIVLSHIKPAFDLKACSRAK